MLKFLSAPMLLALGLLVQQAPSTPYVPRDGHFPGQTPSGHEAPPDDWYCSATAHDEHHCECSRGLTAEETAKQFGGDKQLCEAEADPPDTNKCEVWCFANGKPTAWDERGQPTKFSAAHCRCPVVCQDGHHHAN